MFVVCVSINAYTLVVENLALGYSTGLLRTVN